MRRSPCRFRRARHLAPTNDSEHGSSGSERRRCAFPTDGQRGQHRLRTRLCEDGHFPFVRSVRLTLQWRRDLPSVIPATHPYSASSCPSRKNPSGKDKWRRPNRQKRHQSRSPHHEPTTPMRTVAFPLSAEPCTSSSAESSAFPDVLHRPELLPHKRDDGT